MNWKLFDNKEEADAFAARIEALCAGMVPRVKKSAVWVEWMGRWAVWMNVIPEGVTGDVETIEPPVVEMEGI